MWQAVKQKLIASLTAQLTLHTAQAVAAAITAASVDVPALSHGQLDVSSFSQLAVGVFMQTAVYWGARAVAKAKT